MKFSPEKCEVIRITNKRKVVDSAYTIHGQILRRTDNAKYQGVTTGSTLFWNHHSNTITKKANNSAAFLRRNLSSYPPGVKSTCYKALVRTQLEYASSIWDPHAQSNINKIKAVHRRAVRFVTGDNRQTSSV